MSDSGLPKINVNADLEKEESRDIVTAIADTFSPVSETFGALGDKIRFYRANSAIKNFSKTKEIADSAGLTLQTPPIRFLAPFIEYSSLNEEENETLSGMWASLLLDAGTNYSDKQIRFSRILSEMTEQEAKFFLNLCKNERKNVSRWKSHIGDASTYWNPSHIRPLLNSLYDFDDVDQIYDEIIDHLNFPGSMVFDLLVYDKKNEMDYTIGRGKSAIYSTDEEIIASLSTTNLIKHNVSFYIKTKEFEVSLFGTHVTEFGFSFFNSVIKPTLVNKRRSNAK